SYVTKSFKAEVERARGLGKNQTGSVFLQARQENSTAGDESTNTFLLMPGVRFSNIHYDNLIRPRSGYNFQTELKATHQYLASSTGFIQLTGAGDLIIPLPANFALTTRIRLGATWQNDPPEDLPVSVRFFAGGDHSIRGYAYQSLGPKDDKGNVVGGRNLLVGSVELERYIGRDWGAAVFYDTGNAFNNLGDFSAAQGAGIGIRYYSPIGPVRLDVARQVGVDQPDIRIHLTIGIGL
ncbi:MAG: BamA/TamA family outer membrane protein, partial [Smithella sp.]